MTPQELKNSILQLAVQGKLVEQRPEEGNAEELFKKIQEEKQRLIAEKKIKKEKGEYGEIKEDEISFDIPTTWKWVRFGSVMINRDSERIPLSVAERSKLEKTFDYYGASGVIDKVDRYLFDKTLLLIGEDGANLLARSTPIAFLAKGKYWVNNHAHVLDCIEGTLSLEYMMCFINAISLAKYVTGTAQPKMNQEKMNSIPVSLPPLAEQKRIVAKIEELLPLVDRYEQAWNKLEQFNKRFPEDMKKSLLQYAIQGKLVEQRPEEGTAEELYKKIQEEKQRLIAEKKIKKEKPLPEITDDEKPFDIPEDWKWVRLGNIGLTYIGLTYSPKNISEDGTIVLRSSNIQNYKIDYQDIVRVNMDIPENKMCHVGDILICVRNGSKRLVGKAAIIDKKDMSFGAFMAIVRSQCNAYILQVINSAYFRNSLLGDTGTTTINQITQDMLKNALIPLPPLAEQKRIVEKLEQLLPLCERLK